MFREGNEEKEKQFTKIKAEAEVATGSLGNKEAIEYRELMDKSALKVIFENASDLALFRVKKEKVENF